MTTPITREQAAIIGAYTGILCGPFEDVHELAEKLLGRSVFTHEFASPDVWEKLGVAAYPMFIAVCATKGGER